MLAESIIRIGRPIVKTELLSNKERIRFLTDVSSENCKNYFQNVFLVEVGKDVEEIQLLEVGKFEKQNKKETFFVDQFNNTSFPISYPNGGNPLHAQGIYPIPCYLMYDPHITDMNNAEKFSKEVLLPRINNTLGYQEYSDERKEKLSMKVAKLLKDRSAEIIKNDKQLGILMIYDNQLPVYKKINIKVDGGSDLWIRESKLFPGKHLYLDGEETLKKIVEAKITEAAALGTEENGVSTFSNKQSQNLVSIYNKSWLWLSPTWEMPCSIYWKKKDWTKGIKIDSESYEAFLYGTQFLKQLTVPISSSVLKEMFAPTNIVEAKKHMKLSSFEPIYGIPMVLPLLDGDSQQQFAKFRKMLANQKDLNKDDLHLEILAGMKGSIIPESSDEHRLTIIYYSGDLSRGNMHIRAVIEDILPSIASQIQQILIQLKIKGLKQIQEKFQVKQTPLYKTENLPSLLANSFGPGYVWDALQTTFCRGKLRSDRLYAATAKKLNELANKEAFWEMRQETVFFYSFLYFLNRYEKNILKEEKGVKELTDWQETIDAYHLGVLGLKEIQTPESLGFVTGLLLKQFSNSYYQKTKKDFIKHRVMKFGSKLTPEMIWKYGVLRCEELAEQWEMGLAANFRSILPIVLLGFLEANQKKYLVTDKEVFMTAFWSGYLIYQQTK